MKKILFVFSVVVLLATGCDNSQQSNNQTPLSQNKNTEPAQSATPSATTVIPTPVPAPAYKIKTIDKLNIKFNLAQFPDTDFTLNSITKVEGLKPGGCNSNLPQEIQNLIRVSNGCFDQSVFDVNTDYSLIGVNLKIANNSNLTVQGDLIKLVYFEGDEAQNVLKFAQRDIDFSSYAIASYENRNIQMSFWVPTKPNPLYLAFGPLTSPNQKLPFGQKLLQNFEGTLKIDFNSLIISSSKQ